MEVPRHLRRPGDDGYRTPTIEDTQRHLEQSQYFCDDGIQLHRISSVAEAHATTLETLNELSQRQTWSRSANGERSLSNYPAVEHTIPPKVEKEEEEEEEEDYQRLSFKQRIRHMTWAFFTLTMATGGIANVLYNSQLTSNQKNDHVSLMDE
jgi:hypothetical protein